MRALVVEKRDGEVRREVRDLEAPDLMPGFVKVRVQWSSLNYKDALAATGHPGVARSLPLIPGIDVAGVVEDPGDTPWQAGQPVMVFHPKLGTEVNGGYAEFVVVPQDWVYEIPDGLDTRTAMIYGTAGFTAAQSIDQLRFHKVKPESGPIVVTGSTGGVGVFAVMMLARLGYEVVAVSGKPERFDWLRSLGANEVVGREAVDDRSDRPLLSGRWAGAVDTVGGNILATVLRSTKPHGCVTACGLVAGHELNMTVYPFILRGVTLQGIDSAGVSREYRSQLWNMIATEYAVSQLDELAIETDLEHLGEQIDRILAGKIAGRVIVKVSE